MAKHILIIGSPGSGKSVFSAALASAVGKRNRQTLLISGDSRISGRFVSYRAVDDTCQRNDSTCREK